MLSRAADSRARRALRFLICLSSAAIFPGTLGPDESDSIPWRAFIGPHFYQFESISTVFGRFVLISESWRGSRASCPGQTVWRAMVPGSRFPNPARFRTPARFPVACSFVCLRVCLCGRQTSMPPGSMPPGSMPHHGAGV